MASDRPFLIDVADLLDRPGTQRRGSVAGPVDFGVPHSRVAPGHPVEADLLLESLTEGVLATGEVHYVVRHSCNRCLREWEERGSVEVTQLYERSPDQADEEGYALSEGHLIDLEQLLRDEVTLAFPLTPLCRPDCAGLCPVCGADLNEAPCEGHPEESGSPFAELRRLFSD